MLTNKRILKWLVGMLILTILVAGCRSSQKTKGLPDGNYSSRGYLITLNKGQFVIRDIAEGSYTIDGDKITFNITKYYNPDSGCPNYIFTYRWSFDAETNLLAFEAVDDTCSFRVDALTLGSWEYSKISK